MCARHRAVRRARHSRRRRAAYRGGHDLQLPADQGRRPCHRRANLRRGEGALCHRVLSRRPPGGAGRRAGCRRAGASDDQLAHVRRQQGVRHRHDPQGAEGHRHLGSADLRPLVARARRAGAEAPVHHARPVRGERADDRHAAGAQPRRDQLHDRRGRFDEDRADQHRRRQGVHGKAAAVGNDADDARLVHVVHEERPVLEAETVGRPGEGAQLLSEPRLPRVQRRLDAGVDHAGQGRHLHHGEHHRGPALHGR